MPEWKSTLDVSDLWYDEREALDFVAVEKISARVKDKAHEMFALGYIQEEARDILLDLGSKLKSAKDLREFNYYWNRIYDWADDHRLWIAIQKWMTNKV